MSWNSFAKVLCLVYFFDSVFGYNANNSSCIIVTLYDTFGDGWGSALWYADIPNSKLISGAPNCTNNPLIRKICGEVNGHYNFLVTSLDDKFVENTWEVSYCQSIFK